MDETEETAPEETAPEADGPGDAAARLEWLRGSIDNLDAAIVHLLAERFKCTQQVGALKARHGLPPADPEREAEQVERLQRLAEDANLDPVFAEKFLAFVIQEVVRHHRVIADDHAAREQQRRAAQRYR
jgi:chorismate mutase